MRLRVVAFSPKPIGSATFRENNKLYEEERNKSRLRIMLGKEI